MKSYPFIRIIAAVVVPFLILSCSEKGDETPVTSSFNVESPIVNVGVSGGSFNLEYSIDGPQAGAVADVVTETSWLKIGAVSSSGIEVSVLANADGVDRTGKIELRGKGIKDKTVHVLQSKLSDSEPFYSKFAFDISNVTTSAVDVEITPVDPAAYYYTTIVSKKEYDARGKAGIVEALIQYVEQIVSMAGSGFDPRVLLTQGYYNSASDEDASMDLDDNSEYYVVAFDMDFDESGNVITSGKAEFCKFRTAPATPVDMTFTLTVTGRKVEVVPSADFTYVCGVASKSAWDEYDDPAEVAREYLSIAKRYEMIDRILLSGRQNLDLSDMVENPGEYVVYVVGYRKSATDGGLTTDVTFKTFTYAK